jgi:uncharacterized membrane protein YraQ (UPF0718 family)
VASIVKDFILVFASILYEAMPFIVLGVVIAGLLEELVPQKYVVKFIPKNRMLAIAIGGWLGLLFPMCECGIIVVMRRLLRKGVPLSCCVCYMLAGPIINVVVMLSTFVAFSGMEKAMDSSGRPTNQLGGLGMTCMRMGLGFLVAFGTSLIVEWQYRRHGDSLLAPLARFGMGKAEDDDEPSAARPWQERLGNISETALHDFVDVTVYLILGALLAALARQVIPQSDVEELSRNQPVLAIAAMMALAIVLCLCSEADAFVAASFISLRPASKLAFLVLGPMLDFKLYMMYLRVYRPRLIWTIISSVVVQVFIYSLIFHFLWENYGPQLMGLAGASPTGIPGGGASHGP